jgi:hypothetical protein
MRNLEMEENAKENAKENANEHLTPFDPVSIANSIRGIHFIHAFIARFARRNWNSPMAHTPISRTTFALLGFFSMKNPSLCCKVAFCLRVALQ